MHYTFHYAYMYLQHPEDVVEQFLSAEVYAKAHNQTLSEDDWSHRKAAIFLKSAFFNSTEGGCFAPKMEEVHSYFIKLMQFKIYIGMISLAIVCILILLLLVYLHR